MARLFDDSTWEYLLVAQAVVTSYPFAISFWGMSNDLANEQAGVWIGNTAASTQMASLTFQGPSGGDPLRMFNYDPGGNHVLAFTTTGYSANTWHHACGISPVSTNARVFIDGGSKGTDTDAACDDTSGSWNATAIGSARDTTPGSYFSGRVAEAAIWDLSNWPGATASDKGDEFERLAVPALAAGYSPLFFPLGLVAYWPLGGIYDANDGDNDIVGGYDMTTPGNAPDVADHPAIIYPANTIVVPATGGAPPAFGGVSRIIGGGISV